MALLLITLTLLFSNEFIFYNEDRILVVSFAVVMFTLYTLAGEIVRFELSAGAAQIYEELSFNNFLRRRLGQLLTEANLWFSQFQHNFLTTLRAVQLALYASTLPSTGAAMRFLMRQIS
jgi:hypothetical protein